jgi:Na+-transporting methylmalonyl-CoA/oxaloacetate decarboxylase gamma subunit
MGENVWLMVGGAVVVFILYLVRGLCYVSAMADMEVERWEQEAIAKEKNVKRAPRYDVPKAGASLGER